MAQVAGLITPHKRLRELAPLAPTPTKDSILVDREEVISIVSHEEDSNLVQ